MSLQSQRFAENFETEEKVLISIKFLVRYKVANINKLWRGGL